ncbi:MAG: hypothetical protein V7607_15 [Solirubrobacteraceae bacterium]
MSESRDRPHDARPWDPAGTQPKHDPDELLPEAREPAVPPDAEVVESDAVDEDGGDLLPERRAAAGAPALATPKASSYSPRFQFMTGALVAVGIAAIVGIAVLIIAPSTKTPEPPWSPWKPTTGGTAGAAQIADHVAPEYMDGGQQLVRINANNLSFQGIPLAVELQTAREQGGHIQIHDEKGILYQLCGLGLGTTCAIEEGESTSERRLLLRRAALELALYSFHYLKDIKQVVVLTPPPKGKLPTVALYFQRDQVRDEVARPLTSSLASKPPSVENVKVSPDTPLVHHKARQYLFTLSGQGFNNGGLIVLKPYTAAGDKQLQKELKAQAQQQAAASGG